MSLYLELQVYLDSNIQEIVQQGLDIANKISCSVHLTFSGKRIIIRPQEKIEEILADYKMNNNLKHRNSSEEDLEDSKNPSHFLPEGYPTYTRGPNCRCGACPVCCGWAP